MEMDMSGGPGMAGDGVGEPDATCATTGVGMNPPLDNPRSSMSGGCSKAEARRNNEASAGPSSEPFEAGDSGSSDGTCRATIAHLMRGVGVGKSSAGSNRAAVATAGEDGSRKAAACNSSIGETPPPGKLKTFSSGGIVGASGIGGVKRAGMGIGSSKARGSGRDVGRCGASTGGNGGAVVTRVTTGVGISSPRGRQKASSSGGDECGGKRTGSDNGQATGAVGGTDGGTGNKSTGIGLANCRGGGITKACSGDWTAGDKGRTMGEGKGQGAGGTRSGGRAAASMGDGPGEAGNCMGEDFAIRAAAVGAGPSCEG